MSDTTELVKIQVRILETNYCIFLAEIIEGNLKFGNSPDFEKWKKDDLPIWEEKLDECVDDIKEYWEYIQEDTGFLQDYIFDLKGGVKGCIESNLRLLERRENEIDKEIELKQRLGVALDSETARSMLEKLVDCKDMSCRLKWYLSDFDQNFEKDIAELLEKYNIPQLTLPQAVT
ncbi:MAG: hypothetical protein FWC91_12285 [Defluviitaleaceae bacterium]|nr:hypothetical protein [Defluviitaleaceae bacterium]